MRCLSVREEQGLLLQVSVLPALVQVASKLTQHPNESLYIKSLKVMSIFYGTISKQSDSVLLSLIQMIWTHNNRIHIVSYIHM